MEDFINNQENINLIKRIRDYSPQNILLIQDSEFSRKNIARTYLSKLNIYTGSIEKDHYSFFCKIDQNNEKFTASDLFKKYKKLVIITGIGLYGEIFIKDIRIFEKILLINEKERTPIIIFGSPKKEKLKRIQGIYDLYIDNTELQAFAKLDWLLNKIFNFSQT